MTPEDIADLEKYPLVTFPKGSFIVMQGNPRTSIYFLVEGSARRFITNANGNELTYEIVSPDATDMRFIGGLASYRPDRDYQVSYVAEEECTCRALTVPEFREYLHRHPHLYDGLLETAMSGYSLLEKFFKFKQEKNAPGQICAALYYHAISHGPRLQLPDGLSNSQLARLTGTNRSTVVRIMQELTRQGVAKNTSDGIRIIDADKLRSYVYDEVKLDYLHS